LAATGLNGAEPPCPDAAMLRMMHGSRPEAQAHRRYRLPDPPTTHEHGGLETDDGVTRLWQAPVTMGGDKGLL
jgi:hypothetical protein